MIIKGPLGSDGHEDDEVTQGSGKILTHKGFTLMAKAKKGPVGWVGELTIFLPGQNDIPLQGYVPLSRFFMDPETAVSEALLEGIRRIDRGEVIAF